MKHLPLPVSDLADDRVVKTVCKQPIFASDEAQWLAAYAAYRGVGGDPWHVAPAGFQNPVAAAQRRLYETRKKGGPIRRIRDTPNLLCCPLCGSLTTDSLDHLLPKAVYPEFSIMRANLVPACTHCNAANKGDKHRGAQAPERFIHPYFDAFADGVIWQVRINPPYVAATFDPVPAQGLTADQVAMVTYHLENVLGKAFHSRTRTLWSTYPGSIRIGAQGDPITAQSVAAAVALDLDKSEHLDGKNGWRTALLRGLAADPAAIAYVVAAAIAYP